MIEMALCPPSLRQVNLRLNLLSMSELVLLIAVSLGPVQMGFFKAIPSSGCPLN